MSDDGTWELPGITHWDGCGEIGTPEHAGCFISMDKWTTLRVPPERQILTDLIAELRAEHWVYPEGDGWCQGCGEYQPCPSLRFADRAEARLREVTG